MEQLPRLYLTRDEMMKRIARFKDLKGSDGGLPDSKMPGCERTLFNVIGFQPPLDVGEMQPLRSATMRRAWLRSKSAKASTSATARRSPGMDRRCTTTTPMKPSSR